MLPVLKNGFAPVTSRQAERVMHAAAGGGGTGLDSRARQAPYVPSGERVPSSRALVPVERPVAPAPATELRLAYDASFIAQLTATREGAPQTRKRRRAGSAEGAAHYAEASARPATQARAHPHVVVKL